MAKVRSTTDDRWQDELTPEQYEVLRRKGTEPPFSGKYVYNKADGVYRCAGCGNELFHSDTKFDSGTGWPSFTEPAFAEAVTTEDDNSYGMRRTEVSCAKCRGHLGHVFSDGPQTEEGGTGLRYCINSLALNFDRIGDTPDGGDTPDAPAQPEKADEPG